MVLDSRLPESDNQPYLTKGRAVLEDALLEGQFAAKSALRDEHTNPVRGILAFVLPSLEAKVHDSGSSTEDSDQLVVEPQLDFTRLWVRNHQQQQQQLQHACTKPEPVAAGAGKDSGLASPEEYLCQPNVRGVSLENARPSNVGLELLWFLRSLTNGDVKKICSTLEQTFQDPTNLLDSLASGSVMEVPDVTSYGAHSLPDYTYILDFPRNASIVYSPDGKKHEIELRRFSPRFLADISRVALSPNDSGIGSDFFDSETSSSYERQHVPYLGPVAAAS